MSSKILFAVCTSAFCLQVITAQCIRNSPLVNDLVPVGGACGTGLAASNGGSLAVTSASAIPPTGLVVTSENAMEGQVAVGGQLPLIGSVAMDGAFPSAGAGAVSYACGDGALGIVSEGPIAASIPAIAATAPMIAPTPAITSPIIAPAIATPAPALASPLLGSSCRFGPGKSPFAAAPTPGPGLGARGPVGRGCGFRY
ncbi:hypothetical protein K1T71_014171 [Dendrolimus kikuchii]|uniref:Uncharacterized protein n=1 Tax=Dendrolimus kikuchii TaxID=765133 RepID=A0ACC1CF93_9NEOP|nr:hypothetical protein K1T71_014171 [Dendrolimus kikuchii]